MRWKMPFKDQMKIWIDYSILQRFWHKVVETNKCTSTCTPYYPILETPSLIWGELPYTQWTMWMQLQPIYCHLTYSLWKTWEVHLATWNLNYPQQCLYYQMTPSFLLVSQHTCIMSRRTVPTSNWYAHTEQSTTAPNVWGFKCTSFA